MSNIVAHERLVSSLANRLIRLETLIRSPDVRPIDFVTRDSLARQLQEAQKQH